MYPVIADSKSSSTQTPLHLQPLLQARLPHGITDESFMQDLVPHPKPNLMLVHEKLFNAMPDMTEDQFRAFYDHNVASLVYCATHLKGNKILHCNFLLFFSVPSGLYSFIFESNCWIHFLCWCNSDESKRKIYPLQLS